MNADILASIRRSVRDRGYPPTIRELAAEFDLALGTVHARLVQLEEEGKIIREIPYKGGATRHIYIVGENEKESNE